MKRLLLATTYLVALGLGSAAAQTEQQPLPKQGGERPAAEPAGRATPQAGEGESRSRAPAGERREAEPGEGKGRAAGTEPQREPAGEAGGTEAAPRKQAPARSQAAEPEQPAKSGEPSRKAGETRKEGESRKQDTTEQQPSSGKAAPRNAAGDQDANHKATGQDATSHKAGSDQAGQRQEPSAQGQREERQREKTQEGRDAQPANRQQSGDAQADRTRNQQNGAAPRAEGRVRLEGDRAASLHRSIVDRYRTREHADVSISIGVAVPRSVHVRALPPEIIRDYPEFRDDEFFVEEDQVVIVDPRSREIVEIIGGDEDGVSEGHRGPRGHGGRSREEIVRVVGSHRAEFSTGGAGPELRAPPSAVLRPLPASLASDMPDADAYGYFIDRENRVIVVDRETREVLDIVE